MITPVFDLTGQNNPYISFYLTRPCAASSKQSSHLNVYYKNSADGEWNYLMSYTDNESYVYADSTQGWKKELLPLPNPSEYYQIAFENICRNSNGSAIDSVVVYDEENPLECIKAFNLETSDITTTQVTLTWKQSDAADVWTVHYRKINDTAWTVVDVSGEPTVSIEDLAASSAYEVYVTTICGDLHPVSSHIIFKTTCGTVSVSQSPFTEGFEYGAEGLLPDCWNVINSLTAYGTKYPSTLQAHVHSGEYSLKLRSNPLNPAIIILPLFEEDINTLQISFYAKAETPNVLPGCLQVGYTTSLTDTTAFVALDSVSTILLNGDDTYHKYVCSFEEVTTDGTPVYIAFKHMPKMENWFFFIDDITVELISSCPSPINVTVDSLTANTAGISWKQGGEVSQWNVYYRKQGENSWTEASCNETNIILSNLESATTYELYVQTVCPQQDENPVSDTIAFITDCETMTAPWSDDFTSQPICWSTDNVASAGWKYKSDNNYIYHVAGYYDSRVISPVVDISQLDNPYLKFTHYEPEPFANAMTDTLIIEYRTSQNDQWKQLVQFTYISDWQTDSVALPEPSDSYQIAFHGIGAGWYGNGVYVKYAAFYDNDTANITPPNPPQNPCDSIEKGYMTADICDGDTFTFEGKEYTHQGDYTIVLKTEQGCDSTVNLTLNVHPVYNKSFEDSIKSNGTYTFGDQTIYAPGEYTHTFKTVNGCDSVVTLILKLKSSVEEIQNNVSIVLYPNPTQNNCVLNIEGINSDLLLVISDSQGRIIRKQNIAAGVKSIDINTENLDSGIYYVTLKGESFTKTEKLVKKAL